MKKQLALQLNCVCFTLLFTFQIVAQEKINYTPSIDLLVEGENLLREGEFEAAVEKIDQVHPGDSLFFSYAVHMKMTGLNAMEKYEEVKEIGDKYWYFRHDLPTEFYLSYGTALDKLEKFDQAQAMYKSILKEYPTNYSLWYNYGFSQYLQGKTDEAYETIKRTVEVNPFYDRAHLILAQLAFQKQQTSKALMAFGMYLMHSVADRNNLQDLQNADFMASSKYWKEEGFNTSNDLDLGGNKLFAATDQLVHNYVALRSKYKTPSKFDFPLIKQLHLIATQMNEQKGDDDDFWYKNYAKFYGGLIEQKKFAGFSYLISIHVDDEAMQKIIMKNKKAVLDVQAWAKETINENSENVTLDFMGIGKTKVERNNDFGYIEMLGDYTKKGDNLIGDIQFYSGAGRLEAEGSFNEKAERDGVWKYYYSNGRLRERETYNNGMIVDTSYSYHENGMLNFRVPFVKNKAHGKVEVYENGILLRTLPYENGDVGSGEIILYSPVGTVLERYNAVDGELQGEYSTFYDTGEKHIEGFYKDGELDGERITYFKNGEISYKENYVDGANDGDYISYFRDGKVESKGEFKKGTQIGTWEYFFRNGEKRQIQTFDERGKLNGTEEEFTLAGWKLSEITYNKGEIAAYQYFDKNGSVIADGERKRGTLNFESYFQNGVKSEEGEFGKNGKTGEWKSYRYNGTLSKTSTYEDGKQIGAYKEYFPNGEVEVEYSYNDDGAYDGYYQNRYKTGKLYSQGYLHSNTNDGPWRTYYKNGEVNSSLFYNNGETQGFRTFYTIVGNPYESHYHKDGLELFAIYYDTAGVAMDTIMKLPGVRKETIRKCADCPIYMVADVYNNRFHGEQTFYFPNGQISSSGKVFNHEKEGNWKGYYMDGQLASEGEYVDGEQNGLWKYYHENGKLSAKINYTHGKLNGDYTTYTEEGDVDFNANYFFGDKHGEATYYIGNKMDHKRNYNYGFIETYSYIDESGKEVTKEMVDETASITTYWKNGKKAREFTLKNGWMEDPYIKHFDNGQLHEKIMYKNDDREGEIEVYYANGKLKTKGNYNQGNKYGLHISYYENGKKQKEEPYIDDNLHGKATYYKKDGSVDYTVVYHDGIMITIEK